MASPLTLDPRPSFEPKIVSLYKSLFKVSCSLITAASWGADKVQQEEDEEFEEEKSEGFWTEFFLLKCHAPSLRGVLEPLSPDDLLHLQVWLLSGEVGGV